MPLKTAIFAAAALIAGAAGAHPNIYTYLDANGVRHYTDVPDNNRYKLLSMSSQDLTESGDHYNPALLARATRYDAIIENAAVSSAVEANLLRAVIVVESGFNSRALSKRGAVGLMQLMPATANRFGVPYIAVIGNNSAMNQIRYGQLAKYGEQRGNVGNLLGDVPFGKFAEMLGGYGEEVRDPAQIAPALKRARESVHKLRKSAVINIWVDPREYAPGTKNQTMYK